MGSRRRQAVVDDDLTLSQSRKGGLIQHIVVVHCSLVLAYHHYRLLPLP